MSIKDTVLKTNPDLTQIIRKAVDRIGENHTLARDNKGVTYSATEIEKDRKEWRKTNVIESALKAASDEMAEKMVLENTIDNMVKETLEGHTPIGNKLKSVGAGFVDKQGTSSTLTKFAKRQEMGEQEFVASDALSDAAEDIPSVVLPEVEICWDKEKDVKVDCETGEEIEATLDESTKNVIKKLVNKKLKDKIKIAEGSKIPGLDAYQKAVKKSQKETDSYHKDLKKKMTTYSDFQNNSKPEFPHQNNSKTDYESPMYRGSTEDEEFVDDFAYPGLQDLDIHNMNMEKLTDYLEGSSETGNAQEDEDGETLGNVVKSELGKKLQKSAKRRKEKIAANKASMTNLRGYTPDVQKVKQVKEGVKTDIADMKKLWSYNKNTQ